MGIGWCGLRDRILPYSARLAGKPLGGRAYFFYCLLVLAELDFP